MRGVKLQNNWHNNALHFIFYIYLLIKHILLIFFSTFVGDQDGIY